jgi:hypothetical protein
VTVVGDVLWVLVLVAVVLLVDYVARRSVRGLERREAEEQRRG